MNLKRLENLIGDKINIIKNLNIIIIGLGGVGGYTLESLVRSGVENITIVDGDKIESSNINRQIISNKNNIGNYKTEEWKKRINDINEKINLITINKFITLEDIKDKLNNYDFIIDACDDVKLKTDLIEYAKRNKLNIISSMGTANKMDATKLKITTLDKTTNDPLAKKIRNELKKRKINLKIKVISSEEQTIKNGIKLGTNSYVPAVAGLLITNEVFNQTLGKK